MYIHVKCGQKKTNVSICMRSTANLTINLNLLHILLSYIPHEQVELMNRNTV